MQEVPCSNPECERVTLVNIIPATLVDPSYPDTDTCESCGEWLDFEESEPLSPYDLEEMKYEHHERV